MQAFVARAQWLHSEADGGSEQGFPCRLAGLGFPVLFAKGPILDRFQRQLLFSPT